MPSLFQNVSLKMTAGNFSQFPRDGLAQIAFSGRSNVGKSSLINALVGRKALARVSSSPGKTITVNFYDIDKKFYLVDLPGYGYAKRSFAEKEKWSSLVNGYITKEKNIRLVVQLIDLKAGATADDMLMLDYLVRTETPFIIVATKVDKLNKTERRENLEKLTKCVDSDENIPIIPFSALSGEGKDEIIKTILKYT